MERIVAPRSLAGFMLVGAFLLLPYTVKAQTYNLKDDMMYTAGSPESNSPIASSRWMGVRWQAGSSYKLGKVESRLIKAGSPTGIIFGTIWSCPTSGHADTLIAQTEVKNEADFSTSWSTVAFLLNTPVDLTNGNWYCLNYHANHAYSTSNSIKYGYSNTWNGYVNSAMVMKTDAWSGYSDTTDGYIKAYEVVLPTPTPTPTGIPSNNYTHFELATSSATAVSNYFSYYYFLMILMLLSAGIMIGTILYKK